MASTVHVAKRKTRKEIMKERNNNIEGGEIHIQKEGKKEGKKGKERKREKEGGREKKEREKRGREGRIKKIVKSWREGEKDKER